MFLVFVAYRFYVYHSSIKAAVNRGISKQVPGESVSQICSKAVEIDILAKMQIITEFQLNTGHLSLSDKALLTAVL